MTIYVRLLGEDIEVWRPVQAEKINESIYKILSEENVPAGEDWEFQHGSLVEVVEKKSDHEVILTAISLVH